MCPVCMSTAVWIAGSVSSTSGLAAIAIRKFGAKNAADDNQNGAGEIVPDANQRRNQDVNEHDREAANRVAR